MKFPKLFHYSENSITEIVQKEYYKWNEKKRGYLVGKPFGFWVSVGRSWEQWCRQENFGLSHLKYKYRIYLKKDSNILNINNVDLFDKFNKEYGWSILSGLASWEIHWDRLKEKYDGIIIAPYFYERSLHRDNTWYYGWDRASGVIWDTSCIESFELIKKGESYHVHDKP